ncbi:MAG: hypothetical protein JWP85_1635 [Rhodoglobus sp.]|nr:hypothetical protein [Rhodoglobus sp.]
MTTFQDPPPQSRRAVRQSERGESAESPVGFSHQEPAAPQFYSDPEASRDMWDTTARRAAQLPPSAPREEQAPDPARGRRAAPAQPAPVAEPLTYSTQSKPPVPTYDGPFRNRPNAAPESEAPELPPTQAMPKIEQPAYRVRDFSPESRRAAPAVAPVWTPPQAPAVVPDDGPAAAPSDLDYHTEVREPVPAPVAEAPAAVEPLQPPLEHTMSRREMRALQTAERDLTPQSDDQQAPQQSLAQQLQAAQAEEPVAEPQDAAVEPQAAVERQPEPIAESPFEALFRPASQEPPVQPAPVAEVPLLPLVAPEPATNTALSNALEEFDALTRSQQPEAQPEAQAPAPAPAPTSQDSGEPSTWTPPVGHWSTQADLDDENQPSEITLNRTIGSGSTATNALVLPNIPLGTDIRGPLTSTGEIMLTGSIDLPRTLASSGTSARFDHDGLDALFDASDHELISTDSAPVRAIRAVSTHPSGHGVTHTQKPKGTKALTALLIAAASMAVVVAGLLVSVFAFNVF